MNCKLPIIAVCLCAMLACNSAVVYESYRHIPSAGWNKDSLVSFEVEIADTLSLHHISIDLRNTTEYPYCNLFLFVTSTAPSGQSLCDTIEYMLTDDNGRWLGQGFSTIIDSRLAYRQYVKFTQCGVFRFDIRQGMRKNVLPYITDVGLRIEKETP